jgi:hypothetical protein
MTEIVVPWDEPKYYEIANGQWIRHGKQFPGSIPTEFRRAPQDGIRFTFDENDPYQLVFANYFCKHFGVLTNPLIFSDSDLTQIGQNS